MTRSGNDLSSDTHLLRRQTLRIYPANAIPRGSMIDKSKAGEKHGPILLGLDQSVCIQARMAESPTISLGGSPPTYVVCLDDIAAEVS